MRNGVYWGSFVFVVVATAVFVDLEREDGSSWESTLQMGGVIFLAMILVPSPFVFWATFKRCFDSLFCSRGMAGANVAENSVLEPAPEPEPRKAASEWSEGQRAFLTFGVLMAAASIAVGYAAGHLWRGLALSVGLFAMCGAGPCWMWGRLVAKRSTRVARVF